MNRTWTIIALLAAVLAARLRRQKGFEKPGFAFGCPIGDAKVGSMEDLVKAQGRARKASARTIQATEMRCTMTGDLLKIDVNLNNDSSKVKRITYKFRWIDREGMRAWEEEVVEAAAHVREQQHRRQRRRTDQQSRGLPPDPAEPGIAAPRRSTIG